MQNDIPFTPDLGLSPEVVPFFDEQTNTISYIVRDPGSDACAVVDSVMDIDYAAGRITHDGADRIIAHIREKGWKIEWPRANASLRLPPWPASLSAGSIPMSMRSWRR